MKRVYNILGQNHYLTDSEFRKLTREWFWEFRNVGDTTTEAMTALSEMLNVSIETIKIQITNN